MQTRLESASLGEGRIGRKYFVLPASLFFYSTHGYLSPSTPSQLDIVDYNACLHKKAIRSFQAAFCIILLVVVEAWSENKTLLAYVSHLKLKVKKCRHHFLEAQITNVLNITKVI